MRDFMCLHDDKITRDLFYSKLTGDALDVSSTEKYAAFMRDGSSLEAKKTMKQIHRLQKTIRDIEAVDTDIVETEKRLLWLETGPKRPGQKPKAAVQDSATEETAADVWHWVDGNWIRVVHPFSPNPSILTTEKRRVANPVPAEILGQW